MTLVPGRISPPVEDVPRLAAFLMRFGGVREADLVRAAEWQRQREVRFSEAVVALGVASQACVDAGLTADAPAESIALARAADTIRIAHEPFHPHSERIRALRTEILLRQGGETGTALAVVSSGPAEGRSLLAASLAIGFAQLDVPTLLVDADLRRPALHRLFQIEGRRGLSDAASGALPQFQAVTGVPQLAVIAAGTALSHPQELVSGGRFADLLASWRRRYRHIVLDTPAAEGSSDALAVAAAAGSTLLVARLHHTHLPRYRTLRDRLQATDTRIVGSCLLDF